MESNQEELKEMLKLLCQSRFFQEKMLAVGKNLYTEIGEEAITIGSCLGMRKDDIVSAYFRGDASWLRIKGVVNLRDHWAWWLNRKGEYGPVTCVFPNNWIDVERGVIFTTSSLLGADGDMSCGAAMAQKLQKSGKAVLFMVGDCATSKGNFHEVMNFASVFKLPLVVMVRANEWGMSTHVSNNCGYKDITKLAEAFGFATATIDGNDITKVRAQVQAASDHVRSGAGPFLINAKTYRMVGHSPNDEDDYRSGEEKKKWSPKDPLKVITRHLLAARVDEADIEKIKSDCRQEMDDAYEWALKQPEITPKEILESQQSAVKKMWGRS